MRTDCSDVALRHRSIIHAYGDVFSAEVQRDFLGVVVGESVCNREMANFEVQDVGDNAASLDGERGWKVGGSVGGYCDVKLRFIDRECGYVRGSLEHGDDLEADHDFAGSEERGCSGGLGSVNDEGSDGGGDVVPVVIESSDFDSATSGGFYFGDDSLADFVFEPAGLDGDYGGGEQEEGQGG